MEAILIAIGVILLVILLLSGALAYISLMGGLVVLKFWNWFILPIFPELPHITYLQAVGLMCFISLFKGATTSIDERYKDQNAKYSMWLHYPLILLFGWIIHLCIT